jgi:membrane fusion protein (multidrug efflux system)
MSAEDWNDAGVAVLDDARPGPDTGALPAIAREPAPPPAKERGDEISPAPEGPDTASTEQTPPGGKQPRPGFVRRHPLGAFAAALLAGAVLFGGYLYLDDSWHYESTDDAFIAARQFAIAPKVAGYLTAVPVTDNQHVAAGAVIARIDDRDYRNALDQARGQVAAAQANIQNIDAQISVQQAQIDANQAQVASAQAGLVFAQQQASRYQDLAKTGAGTVQSAQQTNSQLRQAQAGLDSAQASFVLAQRQIEALRAQHAVAVANLAQAQAQSDQAELNLSYTTVTAAQAGRVVNLGAAVGQYAQPGTALTMFVPDDIWVTANFKETQLDAMRPGQPVTIRLDAYPEREIEGQVASVQPGSGTAFSLLPAENATGNYVKIVQRVPVKIIMENPPADVSLGPGMSVDPIVRVNAAPSLLERLRAWL